VTGYGLQVQGSIPGTARDVSLFENVQAVSGAYLAPIQWIPDKGETSPEARRSGREAHHSLASNAKVKKSGAIPVLPPPATWCLLN
jgi:hypothetical protein